MAKTEKHTFVTEGGTECQIEVTYEVGESCADLNALDDAHNEFSDKLHKELRKGLKPKKSKWHRIEDKLPPYGWPVLCKAKNINYYVIAFLGNIEDRWTVYPVDTSIPPEVTHWRELPKSPSENWSPYPNTTLPMA